MQVRHYAVFSVKGRENFEEPRPMERENFRSDQRWFFKVETQFPKGIIMVKVADFLQFKCQILKGNNFIVLKLLNERYSWKLKLVNERLCVCKWNAIDSVVRSSVEGTLLLSGS